MKVAHFYSIGSQISYTLVSSLVLSLIIVESHGSASSEQNVLLILSIAFDVYFPQFKS